MIASEATLTEEVLGPATALTPPQTSTEIVRVIPPSSELSKPGMTWLGILKAITVSFNEGFKSRARALWISAKSTEITDSASYHAAAKVLADLKEIRKEAKAECEPITSAFHAAHLAATGALNVIDKPLSEIQVELDKKITAYENDQKRLEAERLERERRERADYERLQREAEQRRLDDLARVERERLAAEQAELDRLATEQKANDEAARLNSAVQAESEGATSEEVAHLLETPVAAPAPIILPPPAPVPVFIAPLPPPPPPPPSAPSFTRAEGRRKTPERWKAQPDPLHTNVRRYMAEGMDLDAAALQVLIEAAAKDSSLSWALVRNDQAINRDAANKKSMFNLPGFRGYDSSL